MHDAWLDLLLGGACVGCGRPGRTLCEVCAGLLPGDAAVAWPTPCPEGLALPVAAGEYAGLLKVLVNAHKERGCFSLARPLALSLAHAVRTAAAELGSRGHDPGGAELAETWVLVPVPSPGRTVRARGHDPMLRVTRNAASELRRSGMRVVVSRLVRTAGASRDQSGLDARQRAANLTGTMSCAPGPAARLVAHRPAVRVLVTDDVLTTGSTAREAQRALAAAGVPLAAVATVAATRRILPAPAVRRQFEAGAT